MVETLLFALGFNLILFLIAYSFRTDKLTDATYTATFLGMLALTITQNDMGPVKWIAATIVTLWALRLGNYLVRRIKYFGSDKRFDQVRDNFWLFGRFWVVQAVLAWVVLLPVTLLIESARQPKLSTIAIVGIAVAGVGLLIEAIADQQKFRYLQSRTASSKWIEQGLWKYSRHPNYFGEIVVWYGVFLLCSGYLPQDQSWLAVLSPTAITATLLFASGIPILEKNADARWGKDKNYQAYKERTSLLVPLPRKK